MWPRLEVPMAATTFPATPVESSIPRDPALDNTIPLLFTEGCAFITNLCRELDSDIFATRIMLRRAA